MILSVRVAPILVFLAAAGCNTPQSICEDMVEELDAMYARCDIAMRIDLVKQDDTPATCDDIDRVDNGELLLNECIPWAQDVDCETLRADPETLHPSCEFGWLQYTP